MAVEEVLQVVEDRRRLGQDPVDRMQDVRTVHRRVERREPAVGRRDHGCNEPCREQHGHHRDTDPERCVDVAQMVTAQADVAVGADHAAEVAEPAGRGHHQRDDDDGTGRAFMRRLEQVRPDQDAEPQAQPETAEGQDLDQRAETEPVDRGEHYQPDDQQVDPVHRCERRQRCPRKRVRHHYCQSAVVPCSVLRHWGARRSGLRLAALLAAVALAATGCTANANSGSARTPHILGAPKGTPLVLGQPAPAGTGELGALSCATVRRCWAVGVASPNAAARPGSTTVIVATKNGGADVATTTRHRWEHPTAERGVVPTPTDCIAVGIQRRVATGQWRRCRHDQRGATWNPVPLQTGPSP